ncbi:MAG TPA: transglycosylase SLT domain-containing protein [Patescibacteria group bacterium]|nr:transglycosylase SLT domain-containing protein [Patescibacteria group bacterium]
MIRGKKGDANLLTEDIIFITLNLIFLGIMITFLVLKMGNAGVLEETYAKEIALLIDSAKPGMIIHLNMEDGINIAQKELGKDNINEMVKITGNVVTVKLRSDGGYSYSFFNNINVSKPYIAPNNKEFVFLFGGVVETQTESNILNAINYASNNRLINRNCNCGNSCTDYANYISEAASNNGEDPILLLSLMMQESDCVANAFSGSSTGLMQINLIHCGQYGLSSNQDTCKNQLLNNPELNIEIGAEILMENYNTYGSGKLFQGCTNRNVVYYDWDAALRGYNGWGCGVDSQGNKFTAQDNYVEEINQRYDILKTK